MVMRRLTLEGVSPADAAKIAIATPVSADGRTLAPGGEHTPADGYVTEFISDVDRSRVLTAEIIMQEPLVTAREQDHPQEILGHELVLFEAFDGGEHAVLEPLWQLACPA